MSSYDPTRVGCQGGWRKFAGNPVLGEPGDFRFDNHVLRIGERYRMYFSWRTHYSIAMTESPDGLHWSEPILVLQPRPETGWEDDINRPALAYQDDLYHIWYSGQTAGKVFSSTTWTDIYLEASTNEQGTSDIGYATSADGIHWDRKEQPVLRPASAWEGAALMCPTVIWDDEEALYKLWYSGGGWFEPDAIGYATSADGVNWTRPQSEPVFTAEPANLWERARVAGPHVVKANGYYYLFYIGYEDLFKARICLARSRDGLTGWERHPANPIISAGLPGAWDCESIYKPFVLYEAEHKRWTMWFNARTGTTERIGVAYHDGFDLGF
jgi:predicted GH43/DUF377 family glycosyl hydrolase